MKHESTIHVPSYAHEVPGGYDVHVTEEIGWDLVAHVYAPMVPSPRPRVTGRGTFMPSTYRTHCAKLAASLAYARGMLEVGHFGEASLWTSTGPMRLDLAFWAPKQAGDLDNAAKTVMDAGQLRRGELPGAELWRNDSQIRSLTVDFIATDEPEWKQLVVRVRRLPETNRPIAAPSRGQEAPKRRKTGAGSPSAPKAGKGAKEWQQ
jgi:Holliday junction resolvase RusA-like endonuclease